MSRKKSGNQNGLPLHTFWFVLFPILSLLAFNIQETPISAVYRSIGVALLMAAGGLVLTRLAFRDWYRAGVLSSLVIVLFFSYGHVYTQLHQTAIP